VQAEHGVGVGVLHEASEHPRHDRAEDVPPHRVVDHQDDVRIEERQRVRVEAVEQGVQRKGDQQSDREA
jgi:hypothetical protein